MVEHVAEPLGGMVWTMGDGRIMQNLWEETLGDMSKHVKTQQHHGRLIFLVVHGVFLSGGRSTVRRVFEFRPLQKRSDAVSPTGGFQASG